MEYSIQDLISMINHGLMVCNATNTTLVHLDVNAAREIRIFLEDLQMMLQPSGQEV